METRVYKVSGSAKNLDKIEELLAHIEYLGKIGATRSVLVRVDGDGGGRTQVRNEHNEKISDSEYNKEQESLMTSIVGIYDID